MTGDTKDGKVGLNGSRGSSSKDMVWKSEHLHWDRLRSKICQPTLIQSTVGFRSLDQLCKEYQERRREKASSDACSKAAIGVDRASTCQYDRSRLLSVRGALRQAGAACHKYNLGYTVVPARHAQFAEDPRLDDERKIAQMEARESRECGADHKNLETFGKSVNQGWSYDEAVEANANLAAVEGFTYTWNKDWSQETATTAAGETSEDASDSGAGEYEDPWAMASQTDLGYSDYGCWYFESQMHPDYMASENFDESWGASCLIANLTDADYVASTEQQPWLAEPWGSKMWEAAY